MQKKADIFNIIKATSVYVGLILGAGFASGQELISFFLKHGNIGIIGIIVSGFLFSIIGWAVMDICVRDKIKGYSEFLEHVFGSKLGKVIDYVVIAFIFILFSAMLSGSGSLFNETIGLKNTYGIVIIGIVCFLTFLFDVKGIVRINLILSPLLIVGGIFFGLYSFFTQYTPVFINNSNIFHVFFKSWIFSAITYTAYNTITSICVLTQMSDVVTNKKIAKYSGIFGGLFLSILGVSFALPLLLNFESVKTLELPMLYVAREHGFLIEQLYSLILLAAILTTSVSAGFSLVEWVHNKFNINKLLIKMIVVFVGILFAHIGFSSFINTIYPLFGYIGLFEVIAIIIFFMFSKEKKTLNQ